MKRRDFISLAGATATAAALPRVAFGQQAAKVRTIKVIYNAAPPADDRQARINAALEKKGWVNGATARIEWRFNGVSPDTWKIVADEITQAPPDVIIAYGADQGQLVSQFTKTIPIVYWGGSDPLQYGIVSNLARPDGNVTGAFSQSWDLAGKWCDLLFELVPTVKEVAYVRDPRIFPPFGTVPFYQAAQKAGAAHGLNVVDYPVTSVEELDQAFAAASKKPNPGVIPHSDTFLLSNLQAYVATAAKYKLPTANGYGPYVVNGGLAAYYANLQETIDNVTAYADLILRGEKISNMPVQGPTRLDLALNLKTARALELTIPTSIIARADVLIGA